MAEISADARFEELLIRLEGLVKALEAEDLDLERSVQAFEEGMEIAQECHRRLDQAERRVEVLKRRPNGETMAEPFEPGRGA